MPGLAFFSASDGLCFQNGRNRRADLMTESCGWEIRIVSCFFLFFWQVKSPLLPQPSSPLCPLPIVAVRSAFRFYLIPFSVRELGKMHIRFVVLSVMFWLFAGTLAESEQRSTFGELESIFMDAFGNVKDPGDYSIVDPSGNFIRIRGPSQEKFLQELIMEAGRHVLYPPNEENGVVTGNGNYKIIDGAESRDTSKKETQIPRNDSEILYGCPHDCTYYKPVCGSDRRTYKSKCHLQAYNCRTNVTVSDWENCRGRHFLCPSSCLDISDPVCGPDGKIYRNICIMRKRNCGQILETQPLKFCYTANKESESLTLCPKDCQDMYQPVCGSDGVIYYNECFLKMRTCGDKVESVDMRECAHVPKCPTFCIPLYDPVCGSDGKLYINDCAMLKKNCGNPIQRMPKEFCADSERLNDATEE